MLKVHILTDDRVRKRGILAEHGLSLWIEKDDKRILFDTGQSSVFCHNANAMGIDLGQTEYIILSHGHYDHCGGLVYFPWTGKFPKIFAHLEAFLKKYSAIDSNEPHKEIGLPWNPADYGNIMEKVVYNNKHTRLAEGISICGEIPSSTDFEGIPKGFYIEKEGKLSRDMMLDEQMLVVEQGGKLFVFLGCSHPGVVNSLKYTLKLFPDKEIHALVAGMHLENVSTLRLQMTIQYILDMDIQKVIPLHCTGLGAMCEMKRFLGDRCLTLCAGDTIEF
ncbi:MAG: 7,8-dihydropterin-6-yl-methyl-4-(beta-D-ribofuranosyl)aminobenzene 5-phosphate synthase [Clostridiales bacterium]|nr:7,8-dihydropterin-6-yl-methyl-4-(beta-D-ribofuranosyl)aminobenzene 5-phosphate synthase [Clostridiales bacterium]